MNKGIVSALVACLFLSSILIGCTKKATSSSEAINVAAGMQTVQQKADYLVAQAKAFYSSKEFQQAINVAQYILANLDKDSLEAKDLLAKAKEQLAAAAKSAATDVKSKFGITTK